MSLWLQVNVRWRRLGLWLRLHACFVTHTATAASACSLWHYICVMLLLLNLFFLMTVNSNPSASPHVAIKTGLMLLLLLFFDLRQTGLILHVSKKLQKNVHE